MAQVQETALRRHRQRRKRRGIVRVEVQAPRGDAALIRLLAAELRADSDAARRLRALLHEALALAPNGSLLEMLACDLPGDRDADGLIDEALARDRELPRDVEL